ncbi:PAAR domain-containing protein [Pseudomonas fluorescens]|uniref:PAAR domain-containing protein n=1 Tax=Pseudomonas fluorescens TaxID=294 RepID=UPI000CD1FADF|nr:PAAR domain-containing protein [Pseudomonas fluorescens]PNY78755.1 hypothetical protein C1751_01600 [Pseudomonas fluorescens]
MSGKPAARVTDPTACPLPGHGTNPIGAGSSDVFFDGLPAARQGDASECGGALVGDLATTVFINGKPAATVGSISSHGNKVTSGSGTVIIGNSYTPAPFVAPLPLILPGFDEQFVLTDKSGTPIASRRYLLIRENGLQEEGVTSDVGLTHRVAGHASAEKVDIYVASED